MGSYSAGTESGQMSSLTSECITPALFIFCKWHSQLFTTVPKFANASDEVRLL